MSSLRAHTSKVAVNAHIGAPPPSVMKAQVI